MALGWKRNGFTPAKKAACLEALGRGASVEEASLAAGISSTTFYRHEKKDPEFASLCRAARARSGGAASLQTLAWERGVTGVEEDLIQGGKVVGKRIKRSDAVFKMLLEGGDSGRYGPQMKALKDRVEKELRPKIEAEIRAEVARERRIDGPKLRKEFDALLSDFNRRMGGDG